jgi:hypothetical protein
MLPFPQEACVTAGADHDPQPDADEAPTMLGLRQTGNEEVTVVDLESAEPTAVAPTAISPVTFDRPPTHEEIAAEAYAIFEARGRADGGHEDDWLEAERRLRARQ